LKGSTGQPWAPARAPTVARMRPQFGSAPNRADFTSGEDVIASAHSRAMASVGAPVTTTSIILVAPSPSAAMARAISPSRSPSAFSSTSRSGPGSEMRGFPARPLASAKTQSLVDISPSTDTMLNVRWTARPSVSCRALGVTAASVVTTQSAVASCGASMPDPLQIAETITDLPPRVNSRAAIFGRVSVVMIASAARSG